ncbi:hypothetical protein CSB92_3182 [Pseudomonas aeruginosa]|nr:hypothetical protein Y880_04052 [Pseudomonas aeruginosa PAK]AWF58882.1 hypothetical protein CSC30_4355 [Pseudomonas aeruginosa]AWF69196.1 hypothetical protein CSC27_6972 [Pseudomonas aeruginosa]PRW18058.1 hypothetical protein CSB92_3182 [Pseudomonas aeruginosa]BAQ37532.1 hypothetical protein PA257_0912 [Pseudomonas aeruginosa]
MLGHGRLQGSVRWRGAARKAVGGFLPSGLRPHHEISE